MKTRAKARPSFGVGIVVVYLLVFIVQFALMGITLTVIFGRGDFMGLMVGAWIASFMCVWLSLLTVPAWLVHAVLIGAFARLRARRVATSASLFYEGAVGAVLASAAPLSLGWNLANEKLNPASNILAAVMVVAMSCTIGCIAALRVARLARDAAMLKRAHDGG